MLLSRPEVAARTAVVLYYCPGLKEDSVNKLCHSLLAKTAILFTKAIIALHWKKIFWMAINI
jgi:hypothetical protein